MSVVGRLVSFVRSWLGGWSLGLAIIVLIGVGVGLYLEWQRNVPLPPNAVQVSSQIVADLRQTTFRYPGSIADVRDFYKQALPAQGWRYCGTQGTPRCTNMIRLVDRPDDAIDVYRRANDQEATGSTIEVWPIDGKNGQTFVTIYETRSK